MTSFVLNDKQIKAIREHKYSAEGTSICEPLMQKYWRWLVEQIPLTWAPNSITLIGLIINVVTTILLLCHSSDAIQEAPRWTYLSCGLGLFIYQSLDAIDGKQARRTGTNTPLGELFDHGCDAVSTVFVVAGICVTLKLGQDPVIFLIEMCLSELCFYMAHWQTYVTGTLRFGQVDVTEAQIMCVGIYLMCAISPGFFDNMLPVFNFPMRYVCVIASIVSCSLFAARTFHVILQGGIGKNKSTVAGTSTIFPALPVGLVMFLQIVIATKTSIFMDHKCLYIFTFGMVSAKVTINVVVAHMTKSEISLIDSWLIGPLLLFLNQYFNSIIPEYYLLLFVSVYVVQDLVIYSVRVCQQLCDSLGIYCFDITCKPESKDRGYSNGKKKK